MSTQTGGRGQARTAADAADPRLRGRTYAIPFDDVWRTALTLTSGALSGWSVTRSDDHEGVIDATTRSLTGAEHDITIRISLDANAQTRVDAVAVPRKTTADLGRAARRLVRFFKALDAAVRQVPPRRSVRTPR